MCVRLQDRAGEQSDVDMVVRVFRALLENGLNPKSTTADIVMRCVNLLVNPLVNLLVNLLVGPRLVGSRYFLLPSFWPLIG